MRIYKWLFYYIYLLYVICIIFYNKLTIPVEKNIYSVYRISIYEILVQLVLNECTHTRIHTYIYKT